MADRSPDDLPSALDLLDLPAPLQALVRWLRRQPPVTLAQIAEYLEAPDQAANSLATLLAKGYVEVLPADPLADALDLPRYRLRLSHRTGRTHRSALWDSLTDPVTDEAAAPAAADSPPLDVPPSGLV